MPFTNNVTFDESNKRFSITQNDTFINQINSISQLVQLPQGWAYKQPNSPISDVVSVVYNAKDKDCFIKNEFEADVTINHAAKSIDQTNITLDEDNYDYNGFEHQPIPTIISDGKTLQKDIDYTFEYKDNINVSTNAQIVISGTGNYFNGMKTINFTINKVDNSIDSFNVSSDGSCNITSKFGNDTVEYKYYGDSALSEEIPEKPTAPGTYYVQAIIPGTANYNEVKSSVKSFTILDPSTSHGEVTEHQSNKDKNIIIISSLIGILILIIMICILIWLLIKRKKDEKRADRPIQH